MYRIQQVTNDPVQKQSLILPDGTALQLSIRFVPLQYGWFFNLIYGAFIINGTRITVSPNILQQYRNQIPFGLACLSQGNREPSQQNDFSSGAATLYLLDAAEVVEYSRILSGQVSS